MTAEYTPVHANSPSPNGGGAKKFDLAAFMKSPAFYIAGGLVIVLFLIIRGRSNETAAMSEMDIPTDYPNPTNSVDVAGQLSNFQSIIEGDVQQMVANALADYAETQSEQQQQLNETLDKLNKQVTDLGTQSKSYADAVKKTLQSQLDSLKKQVTSIQNSHKETAPKSTSHHTSTSSKSAKYYTVKRGDTLSEIAMKYYGNAYHGGLDKLKKLNPQIKDINKIYVGQKIRIA
jgi:LysM repeat protein